MYGPPEFLLHREIHLDTVAMLKYAEADKRGRAIEKAFLEVGKSFLIL